MAEFELSRTQNGGVRSWAWLLMRRRRVKEDDAGLEKMLMTPERIDMDPTHGLPNCESYRIAALACRNNS
jgi:hypothetical protein